MLAQCVLDMVQLLITFFGLVVWGQVGWEDQVIGVTHILMLIAIQYELGKKICGQVKKYITAWLELWYYLEL